MGRIATNQISSTKKLGVYFSSGKVSYNSIQNHFNFPSPEIIKSYNLTCSFVCVRTLVSYPKGGIQIGGFSERDAKNIWIKEDKGTEGRRKLLRIYTLHDTIKVIRWRRIRWAKHVECM
jgi:hypothetical protein